ncbi:hypothetical protein [Undibacterium sp. Ji49W]|uniref:hypothetical protein n=1 Tax=Undibacterium sp. Ji49W TaxID=3413040 RepID=UPI003BF2EA64
MSADEMVSEILSLINSSENDLIRDSLRTRDVNKLADDLLILKSVKARSEELARDFENGKTAAPSHSLILNRVKTAMKNFSDQLTESGFENKVFSHPTENANLNKVTARPPKTLRLITGGKGAGNRDTDTPSEKSEFEIRLIRKRAGRYLIAVVAKLDGSVKDVIGTYIMNGGGGRGFNSQKFDRWVSAGALPTEAVMKLRGALRTGPRFSTNKRKTGTGPHRYQK